MFDFTAFEETAGHSATLIGHQAGVSTYYCESCGCLVRVGNAGLILFHVPKGSFSTERKCVRAGSAVGGSQLSLKEKIAKLESAEFERLKAV